MIKELGRLLSKKLSQALVGVSIGTAGTSIWLRGASRNMGPYFFNLTFNAGRYAIPPLDAESMASVLGTVSGTDQGIKCESKYYFGDVEAEAFTASSL